MHYYQSKYLFLGKDGWEFWFTNSSDPQATDLLSDLEFVDDVEEGLGNVTSAFFFGYAFLGSRAQLEYIVSNNLSMRYEFGSLKGQNIHYCIQPFPSISFE